MASTNQLSMQGLLLAPLVRLNSLSESLLRSTASTSSSHNTLLKPLLTEYLDCDSQITVALDEARIHQAKQREIYNLTTETLGLNAHLREIITALVQGRNKLQDLIEEGDAVLQASTEASKSRHFEFCTTPLN
jgi:mediator of RNA polymerase II transcription subunit 4